MLNLYRKIIYFLNKNIVYTLRKINIIIYTVFMQYPLIDIIHLNIIVARLIIIKFAATVFFYGIF